MTDDNQFPAAWRPEPGEKIKGRITDLTKNQGQYEPYVIVTLDTSEGEIAVHAFHNVLADQLKERRPNLGDTIEITYFGKREGKSGTSYHAYRVTGGQGRPFSWDDEPDSGVRSDITPADFLAAEPVQHEPAITVPPADDDSDMRF